MRCEWRGVNSLSDGLHVSIWTRCDQGVGTVVSIGLTGVVVGSVKKCVHVEAKGAIINSLPDLVRVNLSIWCGASRGGGEASARVGERVRLRRCEVDRWVGGGRRG